jgi:hypothetical protein
MKHWKRFSVIALLGCAWHVRAGAQVVNPSGSAAGSSVTDTGYVDLLAGLAYTDNSQLAAGHRSSDGIGTAGLDVDYARQGNLSLNLLGNVERVEYLRGSYAGSFYGHFYGSGVLGKPTDPVQWQLSERFGEGMTDPLAAPTPLNLQTINTLSTGPIVNLHVGLANRLTLSGLYSRTSYQRSPYDSQAFLGGAMFAHQLSGASSVSLQASTEHIDYLNRTAAQNILGPTVANFDLRQASLAYQTDLVRTRVTLRAGYNQLDYGAAGRHGAPLYDVEIRHQLSPDATVFLNGHQAYSTNGSSMGSATQQVALQAGGSISPGLAIAQPSLLRSGALGWNFSRARTNFSLIGTIRQNVFTQSIATKNYNHRDESVIASIGRKLRPTLTLELRGQGDFARYSNVGASTRWYSVRVTLAKHFRRLAIWAYAERRHQSGSSGVSTFLTSTYDDNRVGLYFTYDLFGARGVGGSLGGLTGIGGNSGW